MLAGNAIKKIVLVGLGLACVASAALAQETAVLPFTSKSPAARRMAEDSLTEYLDHVQQPEAIATLRKAVKLDPEFAMGHELLAQISLDSAEQIAEQRKAFLNRRHASASEQLVIEWYQDAMDHKLISAITKMNDLLRQYPHDKSVVWMTSWWLMTQAQFERAVAVYERSGITDSPGLINNMGYNNASLHRFDEAFAFMKKYVAAIPGDPNPQDSYAEILRLAGQFDKSIEHYRAALAIDPKFYSSQYGIADTYSLKGDQVQARKEYEIAFKNFPLAELQQIMWQTRRAATYVREADYKGADKAFQALANYAHARNVSQIEADTCRQMAMYQPNTKQALMYLNRADAALAEGKNAMKTAIQQESAQIQRARVELALQTGQMATAHAGVERLAKMADSSGDKLIEQAYHGAAGAVAFADRKYDDAVSFLEEDINNPLSLQLLKDAYMKTGNKSAAKRTSDILAGLNDPTLEQALVVPAFRKCYQDAACSGNVKNVSVDHMHMQ